MAFLLPSAISSFAQFKQFHLWTLIQIPDRPKPAKVTVNAMGQKVDAHDPANMMTFDEAAALSAATGYGIGYVFTDDDPFWFLDIDNCRNTDGAWNEMATVAMQWFAGAAVEVSQSGNGLHLFGCGQVPDGHKTRNQHLGLELYTTKRFVALTMDEMQGDAWTDHSVALSQFVPGHFASSTGTDVAAEWTTEPRPEWNGPEDDDELIEKMIHNRGAAATFGAKASFRHLWEADGDELAKHFPDSEQGRAYDASSADSALFSHLAFWTGCNCERMNRIARRSALVRDKWDRHPSYISRTAIGAASRCEDVYNQCWLDERRRAQIAENKRIGGESLEFTLPAIMSLDEMHERLVFIGSNGAVVDRVTGRVRKKESAADEYAASRHSFQSEDGKKKEIPALKCWIASPNRVTADVLAWVPGELEICPPPESIDGATRAFNTWRGLPSMQKPEDHERRITPFMEHLSYLVPDDAERNRFIQWLAHIIQHPDILPHTAYLMVTEQTGIGRNFLASVLTRVLRGFVAAGVSLDTILDGGFNGRLSQKLLAIVDEVREGLGERRYARSERLKSLITEEYRLINVKYGLQTVEKNCCRWLMFSNHRDALPFENTDRRIIVIENPTERRSSEYYARLYGLIDDPEFIASVRCYLEAFNLSTFNPGEHAPMNAAKKRSLDAMLSETERAVIEFRDQWDSELATRRGIQEYVRMVTGNDPNVNHLTKAIARAGMVNASRRKKIQGTLHSIVIVRGDWTPETITSTTPEILQHYIDGTPGSPRSPDL